MMYDLAASRAYGLSHTFDGHCLQLTGGAICMYTFTFNACMHLHGGGHDTYFLWLYNRIGFLDRCIDPDRERTWLNERMDNREFSVLFVLIPTPPLIPGE